VSAASIAVHAPTFVREVIGLGNYRPSPNSSPHTAIPLAHSNMYPRFTDVAIAGTSAYWGYSIGER
jgi:hypothetical protein